MGKHTGSSRIGVSNGSLLLTAAEGEVILGDWSDEEWDWTWITCADLSKCHFNLYGVFTVSFYQSATDKIRLISLILFSTEGGESVQPCCAGWRRRSALRTVPNKVTGATSSFRSGFQINSDRNISNWATLSHSPLYRCSHSVCMPSITSHHTPLWVCMRTHHIISSEIQLSKGQVSSRAPLRCSPLQNANTRLPILAWTKSRVILWHHWTSCLPGCLPSFEEGVQGEARAVHPLTKAIPHRVDKS